MAEVQNQNINEVPAAIHPKKRRGFWSNIFSKLSNTAGADDKKPNQVPQSNGGMMGTLETTASQVAQRVAVDEASKEIEKLLDNNGSSNNNGSQLANQGAMATGETPDMTGGTPDMTGVSDALSAPTNWAKRMADNVQQKLQTLGS